MVLVIGEDRSVREMIAASLADYGYRVTSAADGVEAIALLRQRDLQIKLVLTDTRLPAVDDGPIRPPACARPPVILMTNGSHLRDESPPEGVAAVLPKPFGLERLLPAIAQVLQSHPPPPP